jgi:hypothetical protein
MTRRRDRLASKASARAAVPTINLIVDAARARRAGDDERWEVAYAESPIGPIILIVSEGWLESLELLYWSRPEPPSSFPDVGTLTPHLREDS